MNNNLNVFKKLIQCCDPNSKTEKCLNCNKIVYTCERTIPVNNDYRCPVHQEGIETKKGWFCSEKCYSTIIKQKT